MEHILVRLELDSLPVTRRLVGLIFNSFLPVNQPEEVWCERCVTLLQMNHAAARRFYQHAHEHTACTNIAKLIHVIRHCLNACIRRALSACGEDDEERGKENVSALDQTLSISDAASMAGLLEIVVILWRSIHRSMENNREAKVYTVSKFASMLPEYMKVFKDDRCKTPLSVLASLMPASAVPTFRNQEEGTADKSYCILLDCLCSWGQVGHILELVCDSLPEEQPQSKGNSVSKRKVRVQDPRPVKPGLALVYVEYLLTHPKNRECLLSAPQKKLNRLLKALETSKASPRKQPVTATAARGSHPSAPGVGRRRDGGGSGGCRGQGLDERDPEGSLSSTYEKLSSCPFTGGLEEGGHSPCCSGSPLPAQLCPHLMRCLLSRNLACRRPVPQVDLESILQSPGGSPHQLSEGAVLRAFSLHCRLSIHLQHKVRPPAWVRTRGVSAQRLCD
ncbi:Condensin-2 complex subunit G2, partial [Eschrichtius robustus]|nr:Condensin-2 complex subunit G2 [Eschrichtius robustus]